MPNANFANDLIRATFPKVAPGVIQQIETEHPFLYHLRESGQLHYGTTGTEVDFELIAGKITTAQHASIEREMNPQQPSIMDRAQLPWVDITCSIAVPNAMIERNRGNAERIADILEKYKDQSMIALADLWTSSLMSDGSAIGPVVPAQAQLIGLLQIFGTGDTGALVTNSGTYLGIDRTANSYWNVQLENAGGNGNAAKTAAIQDLRSFHRKCSNDGEMDSPNLAFMTEAFYAWLENVITTGNQSWTTKNESNLYLPNGIRLGKCMYYPCTASGFSSIGKASTWTALHLNTRYIHLWTMHEKDQGCKVMTFPTLPEKDVSIVNWAWTGAFGCDRLNRQGLFTNRT